MSIVDPPIGALAEIATGKGIVRFCGMTSFSPGKWVGIELFEPKGKNDGSVQGVVYFSCKPLHGVFIRPSQVKILAAEPEQPPPNMLRGREISHMKEEKAVPKDATQSLRVQDTRSNEEITNPQKTIQELRDQLVASQRKANQEKDSLNQTIISLRADLRTRDESSNSKTADLKKTLQQLRNELANSERAANQQKDSLNETIRSLRADLHTQQTNPGTNIARLEETLKELRVRFSDSQRKADSLIQLLRAHELKHQCETLFGEGRISDAGKSLLGIVNTLTKDVRGNKLLMNWLSEFTARCVSMLIRDGDEAANIGKHDEALAAYSTALLLTPSNRITVFIKWAGTMLIRGTVDEALSAASKFKLPRFIIYRTICDVLEGDGRITDAISYFRQMQSKIREDTSIHDERAQWELDFRERCVKKLKTLGDSATNLDATITYYSNALSLDPLNISDILVKRSEARAAMGSWEEALIDATKVTELDPSFYKGHERKHAALHGMGRHGEAFKAFEMMLANLQRSPDPHTCEFRHQFVDITRLIRGVIDQTIRHIPRVLIDITTGCLYDKSQQAAAFEELPIYDELRSSMTTRDQLDHPRIRREVEMFYQYVMFSHKWQPYEPTFQMVVNVSIYGLPASPTNHKLLRFCELVRSLRFRWAWSDTCCVNQADKGVQQESVVAMFRWYRGSSLTVVHLLGVFSESHEFGCLWRSIWNTRGWTYQEYVASKVVQFYTEDWKPYLGLDIFNHKESPIILSEMQQAMNFAAQELTTLQPGLDSVREKLYLASGRQTTREEDIAYSLFGIFNVAIPVIYGEGNQAVGRLLEHILMGSGDVTVLAWTGTAGSYNSCLPVDLTVYNQIMPQHVSQPIEMAEMDDIVTALRSSLPDLSLAVLLYNRLNELPSPSVAASRLRLPAIVFSITNINDTSGSVLTSDLRVYRMTTSVLGEVEIKTMDDLSGMRDLLLIHPWISPLLDQEFPRGVAVFDDATCALRLVARLSQPFGALLLAPQSRVQYRRVATDGLIMVQVREEASLTEMINGIRTVDIQ